MQWKKKNFILYRQEKHNSNTKSAIFTFESSNLGTENTKTLFKHINEKETNLNQLSLFI